MAFKRAFKRSVIILPSNASLKELNDEQRFFVSFSKSWCGVAIPLAEVRQSGFDYHAILGPLQNSVEFARAFQCRKGDVYNPDVRVVSSLCLVVVRVVLYL